MWLFVCRRTPADRLALRELVDMLMMAAVFGQDVRLLLLGDGAWQLAGDGGSPLSDLQGLLPGPVLVEAGALPDMGSSGTPAEAVSPAQVRALFRDSQRVVMF